MASRHRPKILEWGRIAERRLRECRKRMMLGVRQRQAAGVYRRFDAGQVLAACRRRPLYSIVVPVYKTPLYCLRACIRSVRQQLYPIWELILVDDGSNSRKLSAELEKYASEDPRIHAFHLPENRGISAATNFGIQQARGAFVGFLDHDDELTPDALLWMAIAHNRDPQARWFYSDEAVLTADGNCAGRFHRKPKFSWQYLLSIMYTCHFSVYERDLIETVGGLRSEFDGAQDHDLALRISEHVTSDEVIHIPHVLYFWRAIPQSTAMSLESKPAAAAAAHRAVCAAFERRKLRGRVFADSAIPTLFRFHLEPHTTPKVTIIVPTRNSLDLVSSCLYSLIATTNYPNYEIVVIDNQSNQKELDLFLDDIRQQRGVKVFRYDKPFNHSDMHNQVVRQLDSELLVFLNNDVNGFSMNWLERLVASVQLEPSVAGVGARLNYPNGTIQHAGVVIGVAGLAGNVASGEPGDSPGYLGRTCSLQEMSAVSGALMILRKDAFERVGGFDAERYPTSYNDVDLWVRLREAGYRCLYDPAVQATHHEGKSRGVAVSKQELKYQDRLRTDLRNRSFEDPFWNLKLFESVKTQKRNYAGSRWIHAKLQALREKGADLYASSQKAA